jgi:L-glutamine:2-deoxy-scyllo-inosose/3-amino-2,3-dideoxy-scyllo-inosose aminotransferase
MSVEAAVSSPDVHLRLQWPVHGEEELEALREVLVSGCWGHVDRTGAYVAPFEERFERAFADLHGARHGLCVANGTVALQLAFEALDIGAGDEVIVPGLTWQATAAAALDVNAVPVLVDVEPDTYCIDPAAVEAAITPRTKAVVAVHLYNCLADLDALTELCARHGLSLIEDCAHSHGSAWKGRGVGTHGDIGCFSFQQTKSLTAGEGGFCTTGDDRLRERLDALRNCGRAPDGTSGRWQAVQSGNFRLTEWQAAILHVQLERFPAQFERRSENARLLDEALARVDGLEPMRRRPEATRQGLYAYVVRYDRHAFEELPVQEFRRRLAELAGVPVGGVYEPLNASPLYQPQTKARHRLDSHWNELDPTRFELPVATRAHAEESVVLPHELLLNEWQDLSVVADLVERIRGRG